MSDARGKGTKLKLEDLLLRHGAITEEQLQSARAEQKNWGGSIGRTLLSMGYIQEELLLRGLAHQQGIPFIDPSAVAIPPEIARAVSVHVCERFGVMAVGGDLAGKRLSLATSEPDNADHLKQLVGATQFRIDPVAASSESIERAIRKHYYGEGGTTLPPLGTPPKSTTAAAPGERASLPASLFGGAPTLEELASRLDRLEVQLVKNPQFAAVMARLERLEQVSASQGQALKVLLEMLVERGTLPRDEYLARLKRG